MELDEYQARAQQTDRKAGVDDMSRLVALLGLAGEVGSLLTEYKKLMRDGEAYRLFQSKIAEDLGDLLWYLANVAAKFNLTLEQLAQANLEKVHDRWSNARLGPRYFDAEYPASEQFPRSIALTFRYERIDGKEVVRMWRGATAMGNPLTDNAFEPDGYAFHDAFHLAYMAILGWSPVMRKLLGCKRKSSSAVDEVEDGGRAQVIEEGAAALAFAYAKPRDLLVGVDTIDFEVLQSLRQMTSHLEVSSRSLKDWEDAIIAGFTVWRRLVFGGGGVVVADLDARTITYKVLVPKDAQS